VNLQIDTQTLAEMFTDMADIFCDAVDDDGLSMLLTYCLETSGLPTGLVCLTNQTNSIDTIIGCNGRISPQDFRVSSIMTRSLRTLQSEFGVAHEPAGLRYEYAFPLRIRGTSLGVIFLCGDDNHLLDEQGISIIQSIADIAATTIDQTHKIHQAQTLVTQLQTALDSRIIIEQAKGVLAATHNTDIASAFTHLRATARREQRPVRSVAADIVSGVQLSLK
jgi:GAF domain-containing protein